MFLRLFSQWSELPRVTKLYMIGIVLGWAVFLSGLIALFWWSNTTAGSILVEANTPQNQPDSALIKPGEKGIVVEISGAVSQPGVYTFPQGTRVAQAIEEAGFFSSKADFENIVIELNQARVLEDGEKLYIPFFGEAKTAQPQSSKVSVNNAPQSQLEELPSIGSKRAEDIINGRPYSALDELVSKKIVTESQFEELKNQIIL